MRTILIGLIAVCQVMAGSLLWAGERGRAPEGWLSAVGVSSLADPRAAGDEAAAKAKAALGGEAKIVVVAAANDLLTPELVDGVTAHFPKDMVYGCQVASPLTADGNYPDSQTIDSPVGVAVWALGGNVDIVTATGRTDGDDEDDPYYSSGLALGEFFRPYLEKSKRPGNILVTFGDQYNGSNKDFASGLNDGLEKTYPIVGGAAGNNTAKVIVKGEITTGINVVFLMSGDFRVGMALNGGTHTPETAEKTLREALLQGDGEEPFFALLFNCRRRRQGMIENNQLADEHQKITSNLPGVNFFGFYGPGEIGAEKFGEKARGVGFTVTTALLFPL